MELIYSMRRQPLKCEPPHFESVKDSEVVRPICTISCANIIAFSSPTELKDSDGGTWGGHVYVCDLDTPWNSHKVTSTVYPVSALEWDLEGKQLLIATTVGDVSVYGQKEFLLNDWMCLYSASFSGEHIIKGTFFHNGRRVIALDKKPDALITEKIQMLRSTPTLKGFGGIACEGFIVVTGSGLVCAGVAPNVGETRALVATEGLRPNRDHVTAAAMCYKGGSIVVAALCARGCVRVSSATVSLTPPAAPALALQPLPAIHLPHDDLPAAIAWCCREETDSLLIAGNTLAVWKCTERAHPVHKVFAKGNLQGSTTPGGGKTNTDCFNTMVWQRGAVIQQEDGRAVSVCGARLLHGAPAALLATAHALHYTPKDSHVPLISKPVVSYGTPEMQPGGATPPKKAKYGSGSVPCGGGCAVVSCAALSAQGGAAVAVDTHGQLHVYKLCDVMLSNPALSVQMTLNALDYSMVSGYDCLDVLMCLKPSIIETVYEKFTESFQRQPQSIQQYYYQSALKLRMALCRLSSRLSSSGSWLCCSQACEAGWAGAVAALKLDDKEEGGDSHVDQEKFIASLEAKMDVLSDVLAMVPLKVSIQRVADIAITALNSLVQQQHHTGHGYELYSDSNAVWVIRRLLALGRGRVYEAAGRVFAALATNTHAIKHDTLEECASLLNQYPSPRVWEALPRVSITAPHQKPPPYYLEYGVEPELLKFAPEPPPYIQCEITPTPAMDSIRYMYLGGGWRVPRWRGCARCGGRALGAALPSKHPAQRAFDARFISNCRCGGKWTLFNNTDVNTDKETCK